MIDRAARNVMLDAMEKFMRGEITDTAFTRMTAEPVLIEGTDDGTVELLDNITFLTYIESLDDKTFPHNREMWDFFNRARLLMTSDAELVTTRKRKWSKWQGFALLAILVFYPLFGYVIVTHSLEIKGGGAIYLAISALCGTVAYWLKKQHERAELLETPAQIYAETWPFPSHEDFIELRQSTPDFEEWEYPFADDLPLLKYRSLMSSPIIWIFMPVIVFIWCILSPFILLGELSPDWDIQMHLVREK